MSIRSRLVIGGSLAELSSSSRARSTLASRVAVPRRMRDRVGDGRPQARAPMLGETIGRPFQPLDQLWRERHRVPHLASASMSRTRACPGPLCLWLPRLGASRIDGKQALGSRLRDKYGSGYGLRHDNPSSAARRTSWSFDSTPSFAYTLARWLSTVRSPTNRVWAMSRRSSRSAASRATSSSRRVRDAGPSAAAAARRPAVPRRRSESSERARRHVLPHCSKIDAERSSAAIASDHLPGAAHAREGDERDRAAPGSRCRPEVAPRLVPARPPDPARRRRRSPSRPRPWPDPGTAALHEAGHPVQILRRDRRRGRVVGIGRELRQIEQGERAPRPGLVSNSRAAADLRSATPSAAWPACQATTASP